MRAYGVVDRDRPVDGVDHRGYGGKHRIKIEFVFENSVDAFGDGILIAVILIGHARQHARGGELLAVVMTTVLTASIRMMQHAPDVTERRDRALERDQGRVVRQIAAHVPADDLPRIQIRDQKQIHKRVGQSEIGNVTDDDLAGRRHGRGFQDVRRDGIPVLRIRRAREAGLPFDQASRRPQERP